jgi:hypothetical protein
MPAGDRPVGAEDDRGDAGRGEVTDPPLKFV